MSNQFLFCTVHVDGDEAVEVDYVLIPADGLLALCDKATKIKAQVNGVADEQGITAKLEEMKFEWAAYYYSVEDLPDRYAAASAQLDLTGDNAIFVPVPTEDEIGQSSSSDFDRVHVRNDDLFFSAYQRHGTVQHQTRPITFEFIREHHYELLTLDDMGQRLFKLLRCMTGVELAEFFTTHTRDTYEYMPNLEMWEILPPE